MALEFEQLDLNATAVPVDTLLEGQVDAAALHGVLRRIETLGLELVDVHRDESIDAASE